MQTYHRANKRWTVEEDQFIKDNYNVTAVPIIAQQLGRSEKATRSHIERCGYRLAPLKRNRQWSQEESDIISKNMSLSVTELSKLLPKRSWASIYHKSIQLGRPKKFKGWHLDSYGRRQISIGQGKSMAEHRYIVEQHLGRKLSRQEQVHHINCDKRDNRLENLYLCPNAPSHLQLHRSLEELVKPLMEQDIIRFDISTGRYKICAFSSQQ